MELGVPTGPRGGTHRACGSNIPTPQYLNYVFCFTNFAIFKLSLHDFKLLDIRQTLYFNIKITYWHLYKIRLGLLNNFVLVVVLDYSFHVQ